jgi:hypothetical protein
MSLQYRPVGTHESTDGVAHAEDHMLVHAAPQVPMWVCPACTLHNTARETHCGACDEPSPWNSIVSPTFRPVRAASGDAVASAPPMALLPAPNPSYVRPDEIEMSPMTSTSNMAVGPSYQYGLPVVPQDMARGTSSLLPLSWLNHMVVQQSMRGCCQTFFGCDANDEFKLANASSPDHHLLYALEDTDCLIRCCCNANRPMV